MSEKKMFYQTDSSDYENCSDSTALPDKSLLRISKYLEEAEIYISASRKYISATKQTLNSLKDLICHAQIDLNTTEECMIQTESRVKLLKQEFELQLKKQTFENSLSDMYFYATETFREYYENVGKNATDEELSEQAEDHDANRLQQNRSVESLMLESPEEVRHPNGRKFSRSYDDCRNIEKNVVHPGSRTFKSQDLRPLQKCSKTAFPGSATIYSENSCDNSNSCASVSNSTDVKMASMQSDLLDETRALNNPNCSTFYETGFRQSQASGIGHPFPKLMDPCKAPLFSSAYALKLVADKLNAHTEELAEKYSTDCKAIKYLLAAQKKKVCEDMWSHINRFEKTFEGSSSDSSNDLTPLLKERNDKMEDRSLVELPGHARELNASSKLIDSLTDLGLEYESSSKFLKYEETLPGNSSKSDCSRQGALPVGSDDKVPIHREVLIRFTPSKESSSPKKENAFSTRYFSKRYIDLSAKELELFRRKLREKRPFHLSNSEIKSSSHGDGSSYPNIARYHSQKEITPDSLYKDKSTNTDLSSNSASKADTCISYTKYVNQQDEPTVSDNFTRDSISCSTTKKEDGPYLSVDSSILSFENPTYISFSEDVSYPTFLRYGDVSGCDSNSKYSATGFSFNASGDQLTFEAKRSLTYCNDPVSTSVLGTSDAPAESECQTNSMSDDLRLVEEVSNVPSDESEDD